MSVSFYVKNKKKFFSYQNVLTVKETLDLVSDLAQYAFDEHNEQFDIDTFYASPISNFECIVLGIAGKTCRGFEFAYEKDSKCYIVRVNTPSGIYDWEAALDLLRALSVKLGNDIYCENGDVYNSDNISSFPYRHDIENGVEIVYTHINDDDSELDSLVLPGALHDISINKELAAEIYNSSDSAEAFTNFLVKTQNVDAYFAKQMLFKNNDGHIKGLYVLSQDLPTVLPLKPVVTYDNHFVLEGEKVDDWVLFVNFSDDEEIDGQEIPYSDFIAKLGKDNYELLDANNFVVKAMSKNELLELL